VRLFTLKRQLPKALDIWSDVLLNPAFPEPELARQRSIALGRLVRLRDEPHVLAALATDGLLYGQRHPYGRPRYGTPSSLKAISRDDLVQFYRTHFRPDRSALIVVGDTTVAELKPVLEQVLADWQPASAPVPAPKLTPAADPERTRIVLIDKPGAAQSVITVCQIGAERKTPDYFPIIVMNTVFGGAFSSRLNMNLREDKGYTYGARSYFDWRVHVPGPFLARSSVQTAVTAPAVVEFMKELEGIAGAKPVGEQELDFAKAYMTRGYPGTFETPGNIAGRLETLVEFDLPDDYFNTVIPGIRAVRAEDVIRVARKYIDPDHSLIIVVGDRAKIEQSLRELPYGKELQRFQFDDEFQLVPAD
jgi:zinc protease